VIVSPGKRYAQKVNIVRQITQMGLRRVNVEILMDFVSVQVGA